MSDNAIRASLRMIFRRLHLDLSALQYGSYGGVVRIAGTLRTLGGMLLGSEHLEALGRELGAIRGVRRIDLRLSNAHRDADGTWERSPIEPPTPETVELET